MKRCTLGEWAVAMLSLQQAPSRTTIHRILTAKSGDRANPDQKRRQSVLYLQLEAALLKWVHDCERYNMPVVTGATIREKAAKIRKELFPHASPSMIAALSLLPFSTGWLCKFQRRHKFTSKRVYDEAASANAVNVEEERAALQAIMQSYAKRDIYNMNETAYLYCTPPNRTVSSKRMRGRKSPKKRLTVATTRNANAQRPRCFGGKTGEQLDLDYESTPKGWMNTVLFQNWARRFNDDMCAGNRHVLLLLDNTSSCRLAESLSYVTLQILPPNTAAYLQPQDAGIIQALKTQIERLQTRYVVDRFDEILSRAADVGNENLDRDAGALYRVDVLIAMH